ncbi:MAG: LPS-assembly lipoprotein LptE [Acidiferrobacter sp.]
MRILTTWLVLCLLAGCGFHLRTAAEDRLPPTLSALRLVMPGNGLRYPRLVLVVRRALVDHGVTVVMHSAPLPTLKLLGETLNPVVVTINSNGGAQAYLLDYAVTFMVVGARGRTLMGPSIVRVQREYDFDPLNVLSMAREQHYLEQRMRTAAARQIVMRLAAYRRPLLVTPVVHAH